MTLEWPEVQASIEIMIGGKELWLEMRSPRIDLGSVPLDKPLSSSIPRFPESTLKIGVISKHV